MPQVPLPAELRTAYVEAIYEVDFASGVRSFSHGGGGPAFPEFAVLTAWNPGTARPSAQENEATNARLEALLDDEAYCYVSARGYDAARTHEEPSFAIMGIDREDALALARSFGQAAIFWWDGHTGEVVFVD